MLEVRRSRFCQEEPVLSGGRGPGQALCERLAAGGSRAEPGRRAHASWFSFLCEADLRSDRRRVFDLKLQENEKQPMV